MREQVLECPKPLACCITQLPTSPNFANLVCLINNLPYHISLGTDVYTGALQSRLSNYERPQVVVVKVWRLLSQSPDEKREFCSTLFSRLERWQHAASLHPNIANILGVAFPPQFGRLPSLVLPYFQEGDIMRYLHGLTGADSHDRWTTALIMMASVADALHFLHTQELPIVHGGIRGSNILVTKVGDSNLPTPILTDLGLGNLPIPMDLTMNNTNECLRACRWMAPELLGGTLDPAVDACDNATPTPQSDIYAFGMTLLQILSGHHPYVEHRNIFSVILNINEGVRPSELAISRPEGVPRHPCSDEVWELLSSCWENDPSLRPTSGDLNRCMSVLSARMLTS